MTDSTIEVFAALQNDLPVGVFFAAPDDNAQLPTVSFFRAGDEAQVADDEEYSTTETFIVDVWGLRYSDIAALLHALDRAMVQIGFARTSSTLLPKDESGAMHQNMSYERMI